MKLSLFLCLISAFFTHLSAQTYVERANYGQKLEPLNGIIHGAGQDPGEEGGYNQPFFDGYVAEMDSGEYPMSYMYYESIEGLGKDWAIDLREKLLPYKEQQIVIQFGVYLVNQLESIANGSLDDDIDVWLNGIEELGLPVYARLGYEFNGSWNSYNPTSYIAAFRYLTNKIREREDLEIATVWNLAAEGNTTYLNYYPGDEYVDWWALNLFVKEDFERALSIDFLNRAEDHNRPVLIGESSPKYVGVTDGQSDWDTWFDPFFEVIANEPGIKMTGYINWEWADQTIEPVWNNWGDARLSSNEIVAQNFRNEMNDSVYIHLSSEKEFRAKLGYTENKPPNAVTDLNTIPDSYPSTLEWEDAIDESGISRYLIYADEEFYSYTRKNRFEFNKLGADEELTISIVAVDRAGNRSAFSENITVVGTEEPEDTTVVELGDNILTNSEFDNGTSGWTLQNFSNGLASASFTIDENGELSGENSAKVGIAINSGTNFHVLLEQKVDLTPGAEYQIQYQAKATSNTQLETWIQEQGGSFSYARETISLGLEAQTYSHTFNVPFNHSSGSNIYLKFMMGISGVTDIWIDSVSISDIQVVGIEDEYDRILPEALALFQNYPNPFNPSTQISFKLRESGFTTLKVYNVLGMEVANLVSDYKTAGAYSVSFDGSNLSSGVYFYQLVSGSNVRIQKMLLLK